MMRASLLLVLTLVVVALSSPLPPKEESVHKALPHAKRDIGMPPKEERTHKAPPHAKRDIGMPPKEEGAHKAPPHAKRNVGMPPKEEGAHKAPPHAKRDIGMPPKDQKRDIGMPPKDQKRDEINEFHRKDYRRSSPPITGIEETGPVILPGLKGPLLPPRAPVRPNPLARREVAY